MDLAETQRDAYLRAMKARDKAQDQIDPPGMLEDERRKMQEARGARNAAVAFQRAANQVGNFQGQAADSSAFEDYAKNQNMMDAADFAGREARSMGAEKRVTQAEDRMMSVGRDLQAEDELNAPVAPEVVGIANEWLAKQNIKTRVPDGITQRQLKNNPYLEQLIKNSTSKVGQPKTYQKDVFNPQTGQVEAVLFDGVTGAPIKTLGVPGSAASVVKNVGTGAYETVLKNARGGAAPGQTLPKDGRVPAQVVADREVDTAVRKEDATRAGKVETVKAENRAREDVKNDNLTQEAAAKAAGWKALTTDALALYDKSTLVGPLGGRATKLAGAMGYAPDEDASRLNTMLMRRTNAYIKETTGAGMSEAEGRRLMAVMPAVTDSKTKFKLQLEELKKEADKIVDERKLTRGGSQSAPSAGAQSSGPKVFKAGEIPDLRGGK